MTADQNGDSMHHNKNAIAIGCRVSVENHDIISTGTVSYIEGDIIEIEISQFKFFKLGDTVKLTVYSTNGFLHLSSSVIAKDIGTLIVLNPPENQRLTQRRQFPRIEVQGSGQMRALRWSKDLENKLSQTVQIELRDISLGGIGFTVSRDSGIRIKMIAELELEILRGSTCTVEITRREMTDNGWLIGASIIGLEPEQFNVLRGYILRSQIEMRTKKPNEVLKAI